jgi:hypothetical protein
MFLRQELLNGRKNKDSKHGRRRRRKKKNSAVTPPPDVLAAYPLLRRDLVPAG